jgi:hypothetical protein
MRILKCFIGNLTQIIAMPPIAGQATADSAPQSLRGKSILCCAGESRALNCLAASYFQSK